MRTCTSHLHVAPARRICTSQPTRFINCAQPTPHLLFMHLAPQASKCYPKETESFIGEIKALLEAHFGVLDPALRKQLVQALILLRNRGQMPASQLLPLFFKLFKCQDKALREMLFRWAGTAHRLQRLQRVHWTDCSGCHSCPGQVQVQPCTVWRGRRGRRGRANNAKHTASLGGTGVAMQAAALAGGCSSIHCQAQQPCSNGAVAVLQRPPPVHTLPCSLPATASERLIIARKQRAIWPPAPRHRVTPLPSAHLPTGTSCPTSRAATARAAMTSSTARCRTTCTASSRCAAARQLLLLGCLSACAIACVCAAPLLVCVLGLLLDACRAGRQQAGHCR
jgi:hypothetical protein